MDQHALALLAWTELWGFPNMKRIQESGKQSGKFEAVISKLLYYCTNLTKCSVTCHKALRTEHFLHFVMVTLGFEQGDKWSKNRKFCARAVDLAKRPGI